MNKSSGYKKIIIALLLFLVYFTAGKLGLQLAFVHESATAVWPPTGIAIAAFLLFGFRVWPAIYLGAFLINLTTSGGIATSLGIALGNTLEGVIAAHFVNRFAEGKQVFFRAKNIFLFVFLAGVISTTISANIGVTVLMLGGLAQWHDFFQIWLTWWLGDATGALLVTPFILFWKARHPLHLFKGHRLEGLFLYLLLFLVALIVFGGYIPGIERGFPIEFLCLPIIIWFAFRFGRRETITAILFLAVIAIWGTSRGFGPFAFVPQKSSLLLLQAFMAVTTVTALTLAVAVSERRRAQNELLLSEQRFQALTEKSSEAISLMDSDGKIIYVTPSFTNVLGYNPEEMVGKSAASIIHPDDVAYATKITSQVIGRPGKSASVAIKCLHKNGSFRDVEITFTNLIDNPSVKAVVSKFHDITELISTEERIMDEKVRAEALIESIGDGIIATDSEGKIIMVNKAFKSLTGFSEKELLGIKSSEKLRIEDGEKKVVVEDHLLGKEQITGNRINSTLYMVRKNGSKLPVIITATPIIVNKKITGSIKLFHDITREKEIDDMKTEFISMASHELRTPLSAIKGFISMIIEGDYGKVDKKFERPLTLVSDSTNRLIKIVNEMLDVSRIDAERVMINADNYPIDILVSEVISNLKPLIEEKNLALKVEEKNSLQIYADKEKVIQIITNLIGNAIKFTEKGSIGISTKLVKNMVVLYVSDTGRGIAQADKEKLFNKFEQLRSKKEGKVAGTGLGLYISRELARKMKGDLWIENSAVGKGSTFALSLPAVQVNSGKTKENKKI